MSYNFDELYGSGTVAPAATPKLQPKAGGYDFDTLYADNGQDAVQASLYNASFADPQDAASRLDLSKKLKTYLGEDVAPGIVDPAEAQRRLRIAENDHVLRNSPALSRRFMEQGYAARTFDDVKQLAEVERVLEDFKNGRMVASEGPMASVSTLFDGLASGFKQGAERARQGIRLQFADMIGSTTMQADALQKRGQADFRQALATPQIEDPTLRGIYSGVQSTVGQLPGIAAAVLMRNPSAALGSMGLQVEADAYGKYRERGATPLEALTGGLGEAAVEVGTEMLPMGYLVKNLGKKGAGEFLAGLFGREVWTEQLATAAQDAIDTAIANPDKTWGDYLAERPDAAYQTLVATVTQSLIMGGANAAMTYPIREQLQAQRDAANAERSLQAEQTVTQLISAIGQTQSITRDPAAVQELIAEAEGEGSSEVFINARQFANVFNQSAIESAGRLGVDAQALNDALASNGDIAVPLATYATVLAQDPALAPIVEHTKIAPGEMTPSEARLWQSQQGEQFKAEAEAVLAKRQADEVYQAEVQQVEAKVLGELNSAGRFNAETNKRYASMVKNFYVTMSERAGMSVSEMAARYPLRVVGQGQAGLVLDQGEVRPTDQIDELTGLPLNADGTVTVYHHTDAANAERIRREGLLRSAGEPDLYFTTRSETDTGYGDTAIAVRVKPGRLQLDDEFPDGRQDYRVGAPGKQRRLRFLPDGTAELNQSAVSPAPTSDASKAENARILQGAPVATVSTAAIPQGGFAKLREWAAGLFAQFGGKAVNPKIGEVILDERAVRTSLAHGGANTYKKAAFAAVKDVIERGALVHQANDGREDSFYISAPVAINDADNIVTVLVHRDHMTQRMYLHSVMAKESLQNPGVSSVDAGASERSGSTGNGGISRILQELLNFKPDQLNQGNRAFFNPDTNTIGLPELSDLSSFHHESAHFFLEVMADMAARQDAPANIRADFERVLEWFGVTGTPEADAVTTWHLMSLDEKRPHHEKFARGYEAYLTEGRAPTVELQPLFQRFKAWMLDVYRESLKAAKGSIEKVFDVKISDDIRGVYDRLIASDEAIKTAEAVRNFAPVFQTPEQAGMTAEEWAQYQAEQQQSTTTAVDELQTRSIRDMRWLANAKAKKIKELQATAKDVRALVMMEARREILNQPIYRAWQFLTGKNPDKIAKIEKSDPAKINPTEDTLLVAIAKMGGLDRDQAVKEWGLDPKDDTKADNPGGKTLVTRKGGMSIDDMRMALEEWGYLSDSSNPETDPKEFEELFFDALQGGEHYSAWGEEAMIAAEERKSRRNPDDGITLENTPAGKLNTDALRAMYGESDTAPWRLLSALRMTSPDGFDPDAVANIFGFSSGDELVRRLAVAEDPKVAIEALTDQRMLEEHGDLATAQDIERAAERAIHNDVRARVLTRELNALRKAVGQGSVVLKAARQQAEAWLGRQTVRNATRTAPHTAAEGRSAKASAQALAKGDTASAAIHKRDQLLNNQLARGALRAGDEVQRAIKYLKKFDKAGSRKAIDQSYLDQIDQLLERFDIRQVTGKELKKRASLAAWLKDQEELGLDPVIDTKLVEDAQRQHYSTLTLDDFRALIDTVKSIEHMGRLKNRLLTAKDKREFAKVVTELSESIKENANRKATLVNAITPTERIAEGVREYLAMHRKFASLIREMDGGKDGGPMWEYLVRPMNEAADTEVQMRSTLSEQLAELTKGLKGIKLTEKVFIAELGISLRREELLAIGLNSGNEGNVQRLLDGGINAQLKAISGQQLMGVLNRLSNAEWDFIEGVWGLIESNRPLIAAQEKALTGIEPTWIEPNPFTLQSGRTIRGGYFPAKYNGNFSSRSSELEAVTDLRQQMQGAAGRANTRNGYTKERADAVAGRPLRLDLGVIAQHLNEVAHRVAWQQWLIDARRILKAPAVESAIMENYGPEVLKELKQHVGDVALGDSAPSDAWGRFISHIKAGTSITGMGWNIMTSLLQPAGITQSVVRVGPGWVMRALGKFGTDPFRLTAEVHQKSTFMANRAKTFNRELNEVLNRLDGEKITRVQESYFYLIQKFQQMVDVPTWQAAYDKGIAEGNDEARAIALADSAVRDSQGGGQVSDLSRIQKLKQWQLFTMFFSFFNTTQQLSAEAYRGTDFKSATSVGRLAATYLLLYVMPVVWTMALREALRGDDDEEDAEEWLRKYAAEQASFMLGTFIGFRELGSVISGFAGYQGPAGTRFFNEVGKLMKDAEDGEIGKAGVKAALNGLGIMGLPLPGVGLVQLPTSQIIKSVEGTVAVMEGNAGPQAILVGPPLKN